LDNSCTRRRVKGHFPKEGSVPDPCFLKRICINNLKMGTTISGIPGGGWSFKKLLLIMEEFLDKKFHFSHFRKSD